MQALGPLLCLVTEMSPLATDEEIAVRAFEIYQAHGATDGSALDDWLQAERELREHTSGIECLARIFRLPHQMKQSIRYIGFEGTPDGGRRFELSVSTPGQATVHVVVGVLLIE